MDAQLCEKKKISQCNGTRIIPGKCQSIVSGFLTVHNNNNEITTCIYLYNMIFWFYFACIKISPRQTLVTFSSVYFEPDVR